MERGTRIAGKYEMLERLGRGGMGEVWSARDRDLHRDVAVKLQAVGMERDGNDRTLFGASGCVITVSADAVPAELTHDVSALRPPPRTRTSDPAAPNGGDHCPHRPEAAAAPGRARAWNRTDVTPSVLPSAG